MSWDDGKHAKVKRVQLTLDDVIRSIEVEYDGTSLKSQKRGTTVSTKSDGFTLSSDEYITEVSGYYKTIFSGDVITALSFKTNKKTYGLYGNKSSNYFSIPAPKDSQIVGFLGSSSNALNSIDAHFAPVPTSSGSKPPGSQGSDISGTKPAVKPGADSSKTPAGSQGSDTSGTKPGVKPGADSSKTPAGSQGSDTSGTKPAVKPGPDSSKTPSQGSDTSGTKPGVKPGPDSSKTPAGSQGSDTSGTKPVTSGEKNPSDTGTGTNITNPQKLDAQGNKQGNQWDDGADQDGVAKIHVEIGVGIHQIKFDYVKNGQSKEGAVHGVKGRSFRSATVEINHPEEYLVSVEGWYDSSNIQGIQFKTNKKTSEFFGDEYFGDGTQFSLQVKDKKIIGFHGTADQHLNSLGAYFAPVSSSSSSLTPPSSSSTLPANKVEAQGGNYGETFDDGAFDHVSKIYVGQGDSGVAYIKFDYEKDGKKESREHGTISVLGTDDYEIDADDYITSVQVSVDKVFGFKSEIVTALVFKTFKGKTSPPFGMVNEKNFELKDGKGGKLAGFHGKASDVLYALGAYFAPVTK